MSQTKLIRLSSKTAEETKLDTYECHMDSAHLSNVLAMSLKTAIFENNVYNVFTTGTKKNNVFYYILGDPGAGGIIYTYDVPTDGYYTLTELAALIKADINANMAIQYPAAPLIEFKVGEFSKKIEYTRPGADPPEITFGGLQGSLNPFLGNDTDVVTTAASYTFANFANLRGLESVTINVKSKSPQTFLNVSHTKMRNTNSLGVVPVTVEFGGLQTWEQHDLDASRLVFSYPEDLTTLSFTVRDTDGTSLSGQKDHLIIEIMVWYDQ